MALRRLLFSATLLLCAFAAADAFAMESDQVTAATLNSSKPHSENAKDVKQNQKKLNHGQVQKGVPNIDSLANWGDQFHADGVDANNNPQHTWFYNMVGGSPNKKETTVFRAPIIPVSIDLRNADGTPRFVNGQRLFMDATRYVQPVLESPIFENFTYSSSDVPTQYTDAVQRAEFFKDAKPEWHTLLQPDANTTPRTMVLRRGTYQFALNADGTCCAFVLVDENVFGNAL